LQIGLKNTYLMKRIIFIILVVSSFVACSKDNVSFVDSEVILSTKSDEINEDCVIETVEKLDDTYWKDRGITPEYLKTIEGGLNKMQECQIPEKILKTIPTKELVQICLSYPLVFDFLLSNDENYAIDFMINNFNGLYELSNRADGPQELIKAYASINRNNVYYQLIEGFAENLLINSNFYEKLDVESVDLLRSVVNKKISNRNLRRNTLIPQERINNLHAKLCGYDLLSGASAVTASSNDEILSSVITPFGKAVPFIIFPEMTQDSINYYTSQYVNIYQVQLLDSASHKYNCHAYAWASSKNVWINDPLPYYTNNDLYFRSNSNIAIVYYQGNHSAVKRKSDSHYISKWGKGPLVRHLPANVPALYQPNNRVNYSLPFIQGSDAVYVGNTYTYTMEPYMGYAGYSWSLSEDESRYEIINSSGNTLQIKFKSGGVYMLYCSISNAHGDVVHSERMEILVY